MTAVIFKFQKPDGAPVVGAPFTVALRKPSFDEALDDGILLPGTVEGVTDAQGECTLVLAPGYGVYYLSMLVPGEQETPEGCMPGFHYKFSVPDSTEVLRIEDLIVTTPTWSRPWDEQALAIIVDAKAKSQAAAVAAQGSAQAASSSATQANGSAVAAFHDAERAAVSASDALAHKNAASGSAETAGTLAEQARVSAVNSGNSATASAGSASAAANSASTAATAGTAAGKAAAELVVAGKENTAPIQVATSNVDLNTIVTKRTDYYINEGINTPVPANGYLTVIPLVGGTECHQTYRLIGGAHGIGTYARAMYGGTWSAWSKMLQEGDFGLGTPLKMSVGSANSLRVTGFYYVSGSSETPETYGTLFHQGAGPGFGYQKFTSFTSPYREYKRVLDTNVWRGWTPYVEGTIALDSAYSWSGSRFKGWQAAAPDSPPTNSVSVGLDMGYAENRRFQMALDGNGKLYTRINITAVPNTGANWKTIIAEGDYGLGSQAVPLITDYASDIKPGFYFSYGATNASAPANGPVGSGGGSVGVVALQGFNNANYKSFLGVSQAGGPGTLFVGSKVAAGAPVWNRVVTQESAILDPALNTGGIVSSGSNANGTYTKYADGSLDMYHFMSLAHTADAELVTGWTFPHPALLGGVTFAGIAAEVTTQNYDEKKMAISQSSTTAASLRSKISTTQSCTINLFFKGRWK